MKDITENILVSFFWTHCTFTVMILTINFNLILSLVLVDPVPSCMLEPFSSLSKDDSSLTKLAILMTKIFHTQITIQYNTILFY